LSRFSLQRSAPEFNTKMHLPENAPVYGEIKPAGQILFMHVLLFI
jgi:hypothetical protein